MFSNLKSNWRSLHWLARGVVIVVVLYLVLTLLSLVVGTGSWSEAKAANFSPTKAKQLRYNIAEVREEKAPVVVTAVASSTREKEMQWHNHKTYNNLFGQELIWLNMTVSARYSPSQHRITSAPVAEVTAGVTTLGALGQWKIDGIRSNPGQYYTYKGHLNGGYLWWSVLTVSRCVPVPFTSCVEGGSATKTISIRAHYDGTASLY